MSIISEKSSSHASNLAANRETDRLQILAEDIRSRLKRIASDIYLSTEEIETKPTDPTFQAILDRIQTLSGEEPDRIKQAIQRRRQSVEL